MVGATAKKPRSRIGNRRLINACKPALKILPEVQKEAMRLGIELRVSYPKSSHNSCFMHVMFDVDGERLLNYWPSCDRVRDSAGITTEGITSLPAALDFARDMMLEEVRGRLPGPPEPGPLTKLEEARAALGQLMDDLKSLHDHYVSENGAKSAEFAAALGTIIDSVQPTP